MCVITHHKVARSKLKRGLTKTKKQQNCSWHHIRNVPLCVSTYVCKPLANDVWVISVSTSNSYHSGHTEAIHRTRGADMHSVNLPGEDLRTLGARYA